MEERENNKLQLTADPERWVDEYGDFLFNFARMHLYEDGLAEEMVQETFLSALKALDGYKGLASEKSWLTAILKHKIIDHIRKMSRARKFTDEIESGEDVDAAFDTGGHWVKGPSHWSANPGTVLEQKDFMLHLNLCIAGLPEKHRLAFILREFDEVSTEEICNVLNVSATNLWVMLHRARMKLRNCLEAKFFLGDKS